MVDALMRVSPIKQPETVLYLTIYRLLYTLKALILRLNYMDELGTPRQSVQDAGSVPLYIVALMRWARITASGLSDGLLFIWNGFL